MRPHRIREPGTFFHVTARGNNRQSIFPTDDDKLNYLSLLKKILPAYQIRLLGYSIMTNHLHLELQDVLGGKLEKAMHRIQGPYAQMWNVRSGRSGKIYERRYDAKPIQNDAHLVNVSVYMHINPVEAGICTYAEDYRWSSIPAYLGETSEIPVYADFILELAGGIQHYKSLIREAEKRVIQLDETLPEVEKVRSLWVFGSMTFRKQLEPKIERRSERRNLVTRPKGLSMTEIFEKVEREKGVGKAAICSPSRERHISRARALVCALARCEGIPAVVLARLLGRTTRGAIYLASTISREELR